MKEKFSQLYSGSAAANGFNQYTSAGPATFSYDANGNLTGDGANTYQYDVENRLVSRSGAANATLTYDPLGRLFEAAGSSAGTTRFLYDGDELVAEYDTAGTLLRRYVHGPGTDDPLAWYEGAGLSDRRYYHSDERGSITSLAKGQDTRADDLQDQIDSWDLRLASRKATLTAQYTALETALGATRDAAAPALDRMVQRIVGRDHGG